MQSKSVYKFIIRKLIFVGFLGLFFFIGLIVYHQVSLWINAPYWTTSDYIQKSKMDESLLLKVGRMRGYHTRKIIFTNFPEKKEPGTIRIGTFGDSYTFGSEVSDGGEYPSFLQRLFIEQFPNKKIEVLNFGMSRHGFQQSFMLYEHYAAKYNIDYVLLGPGGFYPDRDLTFARTWSFKKKRAVKARYILSPDHTSVELINIKGRTFYEKYKNYYSLLPSWMQMKYDRTPYKSLDDYFPSLFGRSSLFYYIDLSIPEEAAKINKILLKQMLSRHPRRVLFLTSEYIDTFHQYSFYDFYKDVTHINPNHLGKLLFARPLYDRYGGHHSSLGNEIWSLLYFYALIGREHFSLDLVNCDKTHTPSFLRIYKDRRFSLKHVEKIFLFTRGFKIGELVMNQHKTGLELQFPKNTQSFIGFFYSEDFFSNVAFIPVPFQLTSEDVISITLKDLEVKKTLGKVKPLDENHTFFTFQMDNLHAGPGDVKSRYETVFSNLPNKKSFFIYINDFLLGKLIPVLNNGEKGFRLVPLHLRMDQTLVFIGPDQKFHHKDLPVKLPLFLRYETKNGNSFLSSVPLWKCQKEKTHIKLHLPHLDFL